MGLKIIEVRFCPVVFDGTGAIRSARPRRRSLRSGFSSFSLSEFWAAKNLHFEVAATGYVHPYTAVSAVSGRRERCGDVSRMCLSRAHARAVTTAWTQHESPHVDTPRSSPREVELYRNESGQVCLPVGSSLRGFLLKRSRVPE